VPPSRKSRDKPNTTHWHDSAAHYLVEELELEIQERQVVCSSSWMVVILLATELVLLVS